jgi:hypothetical protein
MGARTMSIIGTSGQIVTTLDRLKAKISADRDRFEKSALKYEKEYEKEDENDSSTQKALYARLSAMYGGAMFALATTLDEIQSLQNEQVRIIQADIKRADALRGLDEHDEYEDIREEMEGGCNP